MKALNPPDSRVLECRQKLRELQQFVYMMPTAVLKLGPGGEIEMLNPMAVQLLQRVGIDPASLSGLSVLDALSSGLSEAWAGSRDKIGPVSQPLHSTFQPNDAPAVHLVVQTTRPDLHCTMVSIEDVSATVEEGHLLHQHRQWLGLVLEKLEGYCVAMVTTEGLLLAANPSIDRMFGITSVNSAGQGLFELLGPVQAGGNTASFTEIKTALLNRGSLRFDLALHHHSGKLIWGDILVSPTMGEDNSINGYVFVIRDASKQHDAHISLVKDAQTDPLTGLFNRRGLESSVGDRAMTSSSAVPLACWIMMDIDHFKSVNDTYGHSVGDDVLKQVARLLKNSAREGDIVARIGGEEFLIMLPGVSLATALVAAERLRNLIQDSKLISGSDHIRVTASFGVAEQACGERWAKTVAAADEALSRAKASGRNRSVTAENPSQYIVRCTNASLDRSHHDIQKT
jgi:diguanylate cyclase (GGDEF)-like protein/PAS domain S-box-containing protein